MAYGQYPHRQHQTDEAQFHLISMFLVSLMDDLKFYERKSTK